MERVSDELDVLLLLTLSNIVKQEEGENEFGEPHFLST